MRNLVLSLFLALSQFAAAKLVKSDGGPKRPRGFSYVVLQDDRDFRNKDVIYYFHGINSDASQVEDAAKKLMRVWREADYPPPRFVGISFGSEWLLTAKNSTLPSGFLDTITDEVIPYLERNALMDKEIGRRQIMGMSMGGLNAWELATEIPHKFDKVVLLSPAIPPLSPFSGYGELTEFTNWAVARGFDPMGASIGSQMFADRFLKVLPTERSWNRFDPIKRLERNCSQSLEGKSRPAVRMYLGEADLMFVYGAGKLVKAGKDSGWPIKMETVQGGHALEGLDWSKVARFLSR